MIDHAAESEPRPRVSIVVPTFKEPENVRRAVLSLFDQDSDKSQYEIIVVDSSPDDRVVVTVRALQADAPCTLRLLTKNAEGPGPSRNLGAREARGEFIALMDSDCVAAPQWLRTGLNAFEDQVGIVQGRTLPEPGVPLGVFTWYVVVEQENHIYECANLFYRKLAFDQAGGFDTIYNDAADEALGGEDLDLAWRVKRNGWQSRFCHESVVYHEVQPVGVLRWIYLRRLRVWPRLVKRFPELRRVFFAKYFFDRHQAWILLALIGIVLAWWTPYALALWIPYCVSRGIEPTRTLRGPLRVARVAAYALRDITSLVIFLVASARFRSLVL